MTLRIAVTGQPELTVLAVGGELDLNTAPDLYQALTALVDEGCVHLVVDLSEVDFCDSSGLAVLIRIRNRLDGLAGELMLAAPTPIVNRVLEVSGLTDVFGVYPSVAAARAARAADRETTG
jgi:anti-sigma B factor antagonist